LSKQDEKLRLRRRIQEQAVDLAAKNRWEEAVEANLQLIHLGEDADTFNRLGKAYFELGKLAEVGLLKREKRGNQQVYSADTNGPIYTELASILRKTSGLADVLVQALAPAAPQLRVAFVFGSVAQGRETAGSDIDVMLIGDISFRQAVELLHPTQALLGREVNPKVLSADEFSAKAPTEPFLADVLAKPKLFLIGNAHDLEELARHQP